MTNEQFGVYQPRYQDVIERIARKLCGRNEDLRDDLIQVGLITLWRLEPSKATVNEDAWIRQAIRRRMVSYLRRLQPDRYESLDQLLTWRWELEETCTGERYLRYDPLPGSDDRRNQLGESGR